MATDTNKTGKQMFNIKQAREEISKLHGEATAFVEKYSTTDAPAEEQTVQDERMAKLEKLANSIKASEKLATFAYSADAKGETVKAATVLKPSKSAEQVEAETPVKADYSREGYDKGISDWVGTGQIAEEYATITTATANSLLLPKVVTAPFLPLLTNPYRKALALKGLSPVSYGSTAAVTEPIITVNSGEALPEDKVQNSQGIADVDNVPTVSGVNLTPSGFHSKTVWISGLQLAANNWSFSASTLPALIAAKDNGFAKAITAAIKADANITQTVTTPTPSTISLDTFDNAKEGLPTVFDSNKVFILGRSAYLAAEKIRDSTGMPIFAHNDVQGLSFLSFKGIPVFKDDNFDAMGTAGNMVGIMLSLDGFKLRDEDQKLKQYDNDPDRPDKVGLDYIGYHAFGYAVNAVVKIVN